LILLGKCLLIWILKPYLASDINISRMMPGGYLFNAGVGSDEYSISSINEQSAYCLALNTKRDVDFDRYFTLTKCSSTFWLY
jgi:hypothetical protein